MPPCVVGLSTFTHTLRECGYTTSMLPTLPRNTRIERAIKCRLIAAVCRAAVLPMVVWFTCANLICRHCNRIGNFVDSWYQLRLLEDRRDAASNDEREVWATAVARVQAHVHGVGNGVLLRRRLHLDFRASLAAHAHSQDAAALPLPSFWSTASGKHFLHQLRAGDIHHHFWSNVSLVVELMPQLRASVRALVDSFASHEQQQQQQHAAAGRATCVIHYRSGDFLLEHGREAMASAMAVVRAARTLTIRPERFELLDGGVSTHLCTPSSAHIQRGAKSSPTGTGDCGSSFAGVLARALRVAFHKAEIVQTQGGADDDFLRMALAPMLIVGGGSYALFAALASRGEVRVPRCTLRYAEDGPCASLSTSLSDGLQAYAHPRCHCPGELWKAASRRPAPTPSETEPASQQQSPKQRARDAAARGTAANYSLPPRDHAALHRALRRVAGIYERPPSTAILAKRAVLLTSFNSAYVDLYLNWACHARPHGLRHLVWAQDRLAVRMLLRLPWSVLSTAIVDFEPAVGTLFYSAHMSDALGAVSWATSFRSSSFNRLTFFKLVAVRLILHAGFDAWFCDVDVVFRSDPWPYFARSAVLHHGSASTRCDYEYAANERCGDGDDSRIEQDATAEGNTGFHLFVTSSRTLRWLRQVLELASRIPELDDQSLLWTTLRARHQEGSAMHSRVSLLGNRSSDSLGALPQAILRAEARPDLSASTPKRDGMVHYCQLPRRTHVNGQCFAHADEGWRDAVVIHANWLSGNTRKVAKLARHGLWRLGEHVGDRRCDVMPPAAQGSHARSWMLWVWALLSFHPQLVVAAVDM